MQQFLTLVLAVVHVVQPAYLNLQRIPEVEQLNTKRARIHTTRGYPRFIDRYMYIHQRSRGERGRGD